MVCIRKIYIFVTVVYNLFLCSHQQQQRKLQDADPFQPRIQSATANAEPEVKTTFLRKNSNSDSKPIVQLSVAEQLAQINAAFDGPPVKKQNGISGGAHAHMGGMGGGGKGGQVKARSSYGVWRMFGKARRMEVPPDEDANHAKYPEGRTWIYDNYTLSYRAEKLAEVNPRPPFKYYLSVIAVFKNEAHIMQEWFQHHIAHGVEHFYMVDDHSTDESSIIVNKFARYCTKIKASKFENRFRQAGIYKNIVVKILAGNESKWVAIIDLDEFLYSPQEVDVRKILRQHESLSLVGLNWVWFGSNGHVKQPKSVINSFTMRADYDIMRYDKLADHYKAFQKDWQKYIINLSYKVESIDIHYAFTEGTSDTIGYKRAAYAENPQLLLNHYSVQSMEYLLDNKSKRGSANNHFKLDTFHLDWFKMCDINDVKDTRLADQNMKYGIAQPSSFENFTAIIQAMNEAAAQEMIMLVPEAEYAEQLGSTTEHWQLRKYSLANSWISGGVNNLINNANIDKDIQAKPGLELGGNMPDDGSFEFSGNSTAPDADSEDIKDVEEVPLINSASSKN